MRVLLVSLLTATAALAQTAAPPAASKFPPVKVQVVVGTSQHRMGSDSYEKEMSISPKATIEGASHIAPLPGADAIMLIITMDTAAKYVKGKESFSVHTAETQLVPAAANGNPRVLTFEESKVKFDSYRDSSNVGGAVYKYYVFGLLDADTKAIVDFETNDMQLASYCKMHPEKRDEILKLKKGSKFPTEFK